MLPLTAGRRREGTQPDPPLAHLRRPKQHEKGLDTTALRRPPPQLLYGRKKGREGVGGWSPAAAFLASPSGCAEGASSGDGTSERAGEGGAQARV
jgi:hypothetical protein